LLLAPAAQAADVTIGSNLAGDATSNLCFADCTYFQTSGGTPVAASPVDGTVVRWRLKSSSSGNTVALRVLRPSGSNFTSVASSTTQTTTGALDTFTTSLAIKVGDVLGADIGGSGIVFTNSPAISLPLVKYFQPSLGPGATGAPNQQMMNLELLMNADITPNAGSTPPPPGGTSPTPTPAISNLKLKPSKFRAARSGGSVARKLPVGTKVSFALSIQASVAFKVERKRTGRKRGGKCKLGARGKGKRCTRYKKVRGSFNVGGFAGQNSFKFTGRVDGRKLSRGKYRLTGTPSKSTRTGAPARVNFKIR